MSLLAKLKNKHGEFLRDSSEGIDVFHVRSPHLLTQAAGYLKFRHAQKNASGIFYRGQSKLYKGLLAPALYRNPHGNIFKIGAAKRRIGELKLYLGACKMQGRVLKQVPEFAWEALLQHYGIQTRWLDIVDNVWVALWFACYQAKASGKGGQFLHFERRKPTSKSDFAYVTLVQANLTPDDAKPGLFGDGQTTLIDLRVAAPSTFVRPHAQTGLLLRKKSPDKDADLDYRDLVAGVLRIDLSDALEWLGDGKLLTTHTLFPPPIYDFGYADLLNYAPIPATPLGAICHIAA